MNLTNAIDLNQLAYDIVERFHSNEGMRNACLNSPEFYRACVYESGLLSNEELEAFDGTDEWCELTDILETRL